jgi:N-methylhydantoinase B
MTALADCLVSILGDRVDHAPFGVEGGGEAAPNSVHLVTGGRDWVPPMRSKLEKEAITTGDSVHLGSPGGGGFGLAIERPLEAIELDLNQGLIDRQSAETVYGVVIADVRDLCGRPIFRLDAQASARRRQDMRREAPGADQRLSSALAAGT